MTLTLQLTPEQEARLRADADAAGVTPEEFAARSLFGPPRTQRPGSVGELFAAWRTEDDTDDYEELARRDEELEELKAHLNATRAASGERLLFPPLSATGKEQVV